MVKVYMEYPGFHSAGCQCVFQESLHDVVHVDLPLV